MKKEFFGFYDATEDEIEKSWVEGIFVFDANALLNLYRYTEPTRKDFLGAISKLKDRLFMPYQVGHEYQTNRLTVIEGLANSYNSLKNVVEENFENTLRNQLNQFSRHPSIDVTTINKILQETFKKVNLELDKQKRTHPDFKSKDEILEQLTELYDNKVGKEPSQDELKKIYSSGKERYDLKVPPGYKDLDNKRKKGERHVYGDLIIWLEVIAYTKKEKKPIIFVTDDRKEDWWTIENGKTVRPREELIKEFFDQTGIRILIYNAESFLQYAKERKLVPKIKDASINEIQEVRKADIIYSKFWDLIKDRKSTQMFYGGGPVLTIEDFLKQQEAAKLYTTVQVPDSTPGNLYNIDPNEFLSARATPWNEEQRALYDIYYSGPKAQIIGELKGVTSHKEEQAASDVPLATTAQDIKSGPDASDVQPESDHTKNKKEIPKNPENKKSIKREQKGAKE